MLRRSNSNSKSSTQDKIEEDEEQETLLPNQKSAWFASNISISCQELLNLQEHIKHGLCYKRNKSIFAYLFPCFVPKWKTRYLVVVGNYIYRFSDDQATKTKGVPIPLDSATIQKDQTNNEFILQIKTIRKSYEIKFDDARMLDEWYTYIKERKGRSIQERMGHLPISKEVQKLNKKSDALFNRVLYNDVRDHGASSTSYSPMLETNQGL